MSLFEVHSTATAGIDPLIAAEAMGTAFLLMSELHKASCCEYSPVDRSSIARGLFGIRWWLRRLNLVLEKTSEGLDAAGGTVS